MLVQRSVTNFVQHKHEGIVFCWQKVRLCVVSLSAVLFFGNLFFPAHASELPICTTSVPVNMGIVGLIDGTWSVHLSDKSNGRWIPISTDQEVRTFVFSHAQQRLLYAAADGSVRNRDLNNDRDSELVGAGQHLRQPYLTAGDGTFYAVQFKGGASGDTSIVRINEDAPETPVPVVTQPGAVFSPTLDKRGKLLFYTVAHCTERCGRIIQEVWRKDLISGQADQMTLIGAMSSDPVAGVFPDIFYFSLQSENEESVVRFEYESGEITKRFQVGKRNRRPTLDGEGQLHFLTDIDGRVVIARFNSKDEGCYFPLPNTFDDARELVSGS